MGFLINMLKRVVSGNSSTRPNRRISSTSQSPGQAGSAQPAHDEHVKPWEDDVVVEPSMGHNLVMTNSADGSSMGPVPVGLPANKQYQSDDSSVDLVSVGLGVGVQTMLAPPSMMRNPVSVGPVGGLGGCEFNDGIYKAVKQVIITWGLAIDRIRVEYDQNGVSVWAEHGGPGGENKHTIQLDYPEEFLISVCGHYGNFFEGSTITVVRSLTFQSNRRTYGPYGVEEGRLQYFSFPSNSGKIIGFHGRSGLFLDSIGAYLEPLSNS